MAHLVIRLLSGEDKTGHASNPGLTKWSLSLLNIEVVTGGQDLSLNLSLSLTW